MSHEPRYPPGGGRRNGDYNDDRSGYRNNSDRAYRPQSGGGGGGGGGSGSGDTYRPSSYRDSYHNSPDSRDRRHGYGYPPRDSYQSSSHSYNHPGPPGVPPPAPPSYPQPPPPAARDGYQPPQGDFSFRVDKPSGVQDSYVDSYRPQGAGQRHGHDGPSRFSSRPRDNRRGRGRGGRAGFRGTFQRFKASDRPMLDIDQTGNKVEHSYFDTEAGATYRDLSDLSDDDEADMDISDNDDNTDAAQEPSSKRARLGANQSAADGDSVPKWSNPDPYTALPPPDAAARQRKDVVQLIRKARVQAKESRHSLPVETEDFIPCFDSSDDEYDGGDSEVTAAPAGSGALTGPRLGRPSQQMHEPSQNGHQTSDQLPPTAAQAETDGSLRPINTTTSKNLANSNTDPKPLPAKPLPPQTLPAPPPAQPLPARPPQQAPYSTQAPSTAVDVDSSGSSLYTRKRTYDDDIKLPAHARLKKATKMPVGGTLVWDWKVTKGEEKCPWLDQDYSDTSNMGVWLHKEIVDFYDHVKPQDFEQRIRQRLVDELKGLVRQTYGDAEVYAFGSFPSGLYLPTGDVDLAFISDGVMAGGRAKYSTKSFLYKMQKFLTAKRIAKFRDIELIIGAKVPIVKYIDQRTGLKVDISFEKPDGVQAVQTFLAWKDQYPVMPILVTLIKHFLMMRGLNEPVNGGIGGFAVICLVVSMLQLMPQIQSRSMNPMHHIGDLLMEFFDLYGNRFNYETTAVRLNPPGYVPKNRVRDFAYKRFDRLSIIDPNNPANDITGGSSNITTIVSLFSEAHRMLRDRMARLAQAPRSEKRDASVLEVIFAGNYSTFRNQRAYLAKLAERGLASLDSLPDEPRPSRW